MHLKNDDVYNVTGSRAIVASGLRNDQKYAPIVPEIILSIMHKVARPVYVGIISLEVGWSIERTEQMFHELEDRGEVRPATEAEKRKYGMRIDGNVWTLTGPAMAAKARW